MDIAARLHRARQTLLDLTTRNRLLSLPREGKAGRIVHVCDERSVEVFRLLVTEQKSLQFVPAPERRTLAQDDGSAAPPGGTPPDALATAPELPQPDDPDGERFRDSRLQTRLSSEALQKRLLAMYYDARTLLEEQGVNVLYLALGQLRWFEAPVADTPRFAPLILVPVTIERRSADARFSIRWDQEDLAENLSLAAKLAAETGVVLPSLEFSDEFDPQRYFDQVDAAVDALPGFQVQRDEIALAFFSFAKFLMYRDLDPATWPDERRIDAHPKIMGLLRDGFPDRPSPLADDSLLDELLPPDTRMHVVDADGSQTLVVAEVERGADLVVQGPPGTGKSQTITNLIASAVFHGKTVLFVAEKLAALEVVKRNLAKIGLDQIALELHSNKAHKRAVLDEIAHTLSLTAAPAHADDRGRSRSRKSAAASDQAESLSELTRELNAHAHALHEPIGSSELGAFQVIGALARLGANQREHAQTRLADAEQWTPAAYRSAQRALVDLAERVRAIGPPDAHPWRGARLAAVLPDEAGVLARSAATVAAQVAALRAGAARLAAGLLQSEAEAPGESMRSVIDLCRFGMELRTLPAIDRASLASSAWTGGLERLRQLIANGRRLAQLREQFAGTAHDDAVDRDWAADRHAFIEHGRSLLRWFKRDYRECVRQLKLALTTPAPKAYAERLELFDRLAEARQLALAIDAEASLGVSAFGELWLGRASSWDALDAQVRWVDGFRALHQERARLEVAARVAEPAALGAFAAELCARASTLGPPLQKLVDALQLDLRAAFDVDSVEDVGLARWEERLQSWSGRAAELTDWVNFRVAAERIRNGPLQPFFEPIVQRRLGPADCTDALGQAYLHALLRSAVQRHPRLARFEGRTQTHLVERFQAADRERLHWCREAVGRRHLAQVPRANTGVGALGLVHREINRRRGNAPIRKLIASAGSVIQQAKPLFMMSPLSVAQFLQPGAVEFDLLIIDEASQVEPIDALGAIARCRQVVVVGDDKQLPPTRFFSRMTGNDEAVEDDDEDASTTVVESVLGLCASMGVPNRMLRWHYRSRHHSLIAVSNQEFYRHLCIVPSPESQTADLGVKFHWIDGVYDRGKSRQNPLEAAAIARAVIAFAEREPERTLGVVAFSEAQKQAVLDALEIERRLRPDLEDFFAGDRAEPFFVKNLENVQGDERDVIMISIGYARDASGCLAMAFGPLTNKGGERRLNVLISRARLRCDVYSSIRGDDIDLTRTQSVGARVLKLYLKFAETGRLDVPAGATRDADSDFESVLKTRLEQAGHTVHARVGIAGFFIDLAVVDPVESGRYVIGIECDGAAYGAARSARDRDRLRQTVLENNGWRIQRIWSADWLHRPDLTLQQTLAAIDAAIADSAAGVAAAGRITPAADATTAFQVVAAPDGSVRDAGIVDAGTPYIEASFTVPVDTAVHQLPLGKLTSIVTRIVEIEQPIHDSEVAQRVRVLWGHARIGSRMAGAVASAIANALRFRKLGRDDEGFLFVPDSTSALPIRDRSGVVSRSLRLPQSLPPSEIRLAIVKLVEISHELAPDEVAPSVCRWLGFQKASAELRAIVEEQIAVCAQRGLVACAEGRIRQREDLRP